MQSSVTIVGFAPAPQLAAPAAVFCRGITKDFGDGSERVQALRGVDLDVPAGEMTLLVGPSGCGKTTLISIIGGLLEPTAGSISVLGTDLGKLSGRQKVRFRASNIGFVFQQYALLPALTAAENAAVPLVIAGESRAGRCSRLASCWPSSASETVCIHCRRSSPEDSSNAWRSRGP